MNGAALFGSCAPLALVLASCTCGERAAEKRSAAPAAGSGSMRVAADARFELLSIVFRLAGNAEYRRATGPYAAAVDAHFAPFANHDAVRLAASLRQEHGVSYEAPMQLALHLDASLQPAFPLDPLPAALLPRWKGAPITVFVAALRELAHASRLDDFLRAQATYREEVVARLRNVVPGATIAGWFDAVFGARTGAQHLVVPGFLSGPMAYGVRASLPSGELDAQVVMLESPDERGLPRPSEKTLSVLVHELAHAYVNPVVERRMAELEPAASRVFRSVEAAMRRQHYATAAIVAGESLVRALTILYLRECGASRLAEESLVEERRRSFLWIDSLVSALDAERKKAGGRLSERAMLEAARAVFEGWGAAEPALP